MADSVFNISKGSFVEKIRDAATNVLKEKKPETTPSRIPLVISLAKLKLDPDVKWRKHWRCSDSLISQGFIRSEENWKTLASKDVQFPALKITFTFVNTISVNGWNLTCQSYNTHPKICRGFMFKYHNLMFKHHNNFVLDYIYTYYVYMTWTTQSRFLLCGLWY